MQPGSGLLDEPGRRANPFAAARAFFTREGAVDPNSAPFARRETDDPLFARNSITGEPLRLAPLESPTSEDDPPAAPSLEDIERILTSRGYRYRPDPMGRIGEGDWLDAGGNPLDLSTKEAIVRGESSGADASTSLHVESAEDLERIIEQLPINSEPENGSDKDEGVTTVQDDGGGRVWGRFGAALAKGGKIIGGPSSMPAELARRLSYIKDPYTRTTVERVISGGVPDKSGRFEPKGDYNLFKMGGRSMASNDFFYLQLRLGGGRIQRQDKAIYFEGRDGTVISLRRSLDKNEKAVTTEIHINRPDLQSGHDKIKIRYEEKAVWEVR